MNIARGLLSAAALGALVGPAGCSSAWHRVDEEPPFRLDRRPLELVAHRAVERVTLHIRGREFEFVGYRTCDPAAGDVRVQLLLESGISAIDVAVHGAQNERIAGSAFEAIPRFAEIAMEDLRRIWGSRSIFTLSVPATGFHVSPRGAWSLMKEPPYPALPLGDGTFLALPYEYETGERRMYSILGADLVGESRVEYSDFDENGVPRAISFTDLRDEHTLDIEIEEVRLAPAKADAPAKP